MGHFAADRERVVDALLSEPDCIEEPPIQRFYEIWDRARRGRRFPTKSDLDPCTFPDLLGDTMLIDVLDGGLDFRFRLVGTRIVENMDCNVTGKRFGPLCGDGAGEFVGFLDALCRETLDARRPIYAAGVFVTELGVERGCRRIMCPCSSDGETIDLIASVALFLLQPMDLHRPFDRDGLVRTVFSRPVQDQPAPARIAVPA